MTATIQASARKCVCFAVTFIFAAAMCADAKDQGGFDVRGLYAFQNGLGLGSPEDDALVLKELGYAGVSQVMDQGPALASRVAAYDKIGLRVLSVYLNVDGRPIDAEAVAPLRDRDALIELTVREMNPRTVEAVRQTAEMAASINIKVALYPHFGFGIATMPQAMDLIGKVNHPNLGLMFNLCHFLKSENAEDLEKALKQAGPRLFGVSTAGADIDGKGWGALIQTLDQGSFPQKRLLEALDAADFHGPITLQCYALPGDKRTNLERSMAAWKRFNGVVGKTPPNIIVLLCDDLGYGDVQCLNPQRGKIPTPHLDALAKSGMVFTDAHSASSVCTPTRYGLLTGRYAWRTTLQKGVVQGFSPVLIAADRPTVASFLKSHGYHTAILGKWHLNFLYTDPKTGANLDERKVPKGLAPVGSKIPDGPTSRGFDYFHGFHHAADMECVIENDAVVEHDDPINMLPRLTQKAVTYLDERAKDNDTPFFLYLPYGSPHSPILPSKEWQGKSGINAYADFVMQNDDSVGQILAALGNNGQRENTLIIFSSDNGCSAKDAKVKELNKHGHYSSAGYRGYKTELWEGGHRVPFLASWPARIQPGTTNDSTICLNDLFATCAELLGAKTPANSCEDSVSFLPAFQNKPISSTRRGIVHHSYQGFFAYRMGDWNLLLARDRGAAQLYDLSKDPAETANLYQANPTKADELLAALENDIRRGRSTDGPESSNDIDQIVLWKSDSGKTTRTHPNKP